MRLFTFALVALLQLASAQASLKKLPIQDGGRIKPYDTFAREILHLTWGKENYNGQPATEIVLSWLIAPEIWDNNPFIQIRHAGLRESMQLESKRIYYSPNEVMGNDRLQLLMQELKNKRDIKEKLNPFYQAVQTLENQLIYYNAMKAGLLLRLVPSEGKSAWHNISELGPDYKDRFQKIRQAFVAVAEISAVKDGEKPDKKKVSEARAALDTAALDFQLYVESMHPQYAPQSKISAEVIYNSSLPFRWAWVVYFLALILFSFAYFAEKSHWEKAAWAFVVLGALFHIFGFGLRVYILERAPVTNMFETVAWVAFVSILFALAIHVFLQRSLLLPIGSMMVNVLSLILCDISSSVLDDSLTPLEPVLRDNFWLLTHVVIIVSSYAAFFLAFFIGDIMLFYFLRDEKKYQAKINEGALAIYRSMQIGIVLLAAGTILGGVWADYSWGRFWGWDPKETWAFIALMGYLAILHARLMGWLKQFGMAVCAVVAFSLVIMAWYGVNFVLGAGLHSYGFGAGGVEYVTGFVVLHLIFVGGVVTLRQSRLSS